MRYIALAMVLALAACTNPPEAKRVLEENGYADVQTTGYAWFACSKDDFYHTGFTATGPHGTPVYGVVCSGLLFKSSTIRF